MTADGRHSTQLRNHIIEAWTFANAAARAAGTGYTIVAEDVGKIAYQTDTGAYSRLLSIGPLAWQPIITGSGAPVDAYYLTRQSESGLSNEFSLANISAGVLKHSVSGGFSTPAAAVVGVDYASPYITFRSVSGTTDTLLLADAGNGVEYTSGSAVTVTVPPASSVAWVVGTVIELNQYGSGQVSITNGSGVTLHSDGNKLKIAGQYGTVGLRYRGSDVWILSGDLSA